MEKVHEYLAVWQQTDIVQAIPYLFKTTVKFSHVRLGTVPFPKVIPPSDLGHVSRGHLNDRTLLEIVISISTHVQDTSPSPIQPIYIQPMNGRLALYQLHLAQITSNQCLVFVKIPNFSPLNTE